MAKAKKASTPKSTKSPAEKSAAPVVPAIDPSSVVASAAKLVGAGLSPLAPAPMTHTESAGFRNLKQNLNKPTGGPLGGLLDKTTPAGTKRPMPGATRNQAGHHNQLVGHAASRTNVPRRNAGG